MPISYAKVVDVPEVKDDSGPLRDGSGVKKFIYAGSSIIASIEGSGVEYYHKDRLSNRIVTNENGEVTGEFLSLPFGQKVINSGVDYPFTGKGEDESSLYYFGARYYDDNLGRFGGVDPYAGQDGNLPYAYVANNPMNLVDPTGEYVADDRFSDNQVHMTNAALSGGLAFGTGVVRKIAGRGDSWTDIMRNTLVAAGTGYTSSHLKKFAVQNPDDINILMAGFADDLVSSVRANVMQNKDWNSNFMFNYLGLIAERDNGNWEFGIDIGDPIALGVISSFGGEIDWGRSFSTGNYVLMRGSYLRGKDKGYGLMSVTTMFSDYDSAYEESSFRSVYGHEHGHTMQSTEAASFWRGMGIPYKAKGWGINWYSDRSMGSGLFLGLGVTGMERYNKPAEVEMDYWDLDKKDYH